MKIVDDILNFLLYFVRAHLSQSVPLMTRFQVRVCGPPRVCSLNDALLASMEVMKENNSADRIRGTWESSTGLR
jgi:hypothetical protein